MTEGLAPHHVELLAASGISAEFAAVHGVSSVRDVTSLPDEFSGNPFAAVPALRFTWSSPSRGPVHQLRPDVPVAREGTTDQVKYVFPSGSTSVLNAILTEGDTVLLVEGTRQSLAAAEHAPEGVAVYGMAGCWGWRTDGVSAPDLAELEGKRVVVVLDADAASNADVYGAGVALRDALLADGAEWVRFLRLPAGKKAGLDDVLGAQAADRRADYLRRLVDQVTGAKQAEVRALEKPAAKKPAPKKEDREGGENGPSAEKISVATQLVQLATAGYWFGCTLDGEPFALPRTGPRIVRLLRGGRQSLRAELSSAYYQASGSAPSQSALADACAVLEGVAQHEEPADLYLRVAEHEGDLVLDLGDTAGRCVVLTAAGWQVVDTPPVLFRRTQLTGALPEPTGGGDFSDLWDALNVAERYRPLVLAVLVAALLPGIPHPVVLLTGEQGTGKSTATARLASIIDPSPAQLRKPPRDLEQWTTAAAGSWVVALDNLSSIPEWLSDALCRASTGDGDVRRRLFTDGDLHVIAFRRMPVINGIDVGALRGDLADRLVHLALDRIPDKSRRRDEEMAAAWRRAHPTVLGALLDLTAKVLTALPTTELESAPRMADFARVLAAVDQVNGTDGLSVYRGLRDELAQDAATSDPVLIALAEKITEEFTGISGELLDLITPRDDEGRALPPQRLPKGWPSSARALTATLTRQAPTLRQLGWAVGTASHRGGKQLAWSLTPPLSEEKEEDAGGQDRSRGENGSADTADTADGPFLHVNGHGETAGSGAGSVPPDGALSAVPVVTASSGSNTAPDPAAGSLPLSSENVAGNLGSAADVRVSTRQALPRDWVALITLDSSVAPPTTTCPGCDGVEVPDSELGIFPVCPTCTPGSLLPGGSS